jgi:hypothetical protein
MTRASIVVISAFLFGLAASSAVSSINAAPAPLAGATATEIGTGTAGRHVAVGWFSRRVVIR